MRLAGDLIFMMNLAQERQLRFFSRPLVFVERSLWLPLVNKNVSVFWRLTLSENDFLIGTEEKESMNDISIESIQTFARYASQRSRYYAELEGERL